MASPSTPDVEVEELGPDGRPRVVFQWRSATGKLQMSILPSSTIPKTGTSILHKCMSPFLPAGYPSTVTPDYTPYQIYDSLQAFASTVAGLLASRAVFVGMGVGSENASLVTTMLLYIAQETIGRVATILFAHQFSQRIEAEVKFYRYFADIVNDIAFVLDCMSPAMPTLGRVVTLCVSNACRAVCGVAGGSSKAILSSHFAKAGNIGELNAKDGSQETVVSLVGMWVGGVVVSKVHGTVATWNCLIPLLAFHLWANWKAVRSVRLNFLNADRALILFRSILDGHVKDLDQVREEETILGWDNKSRGIHGLDLWKIRVGVGLKDLVSSMKLPHNSQSQASGDLVQLLRIFHEEEYVLWFDVGTREALILLKDTATGATQAQCVCHMLQCCIATQSLTKSTGEAGPVEENGKEPRNKRITVTKRSDEKLHIGPEIQDIAKRRMTGSSDHHRSIQLLKESLDENREQWSKIRDQAEKAGWNLDLTNLVKGQGTRIRLNSLQEDKKVK